MASILACEQEWRRLSTEHIATILGGGFKCSPHLLVETFSGRISRWHFIVSFLRSQWFETIRERSNAQRRTLAGFSNFGPSATICRNPARHLRPQYDIDLFDIGIPEATMIKRKVWEGRLGQHQIGVGQFRFGLLSFGQTWTMLSVYSTNLCLLS